MGGGRGSALNMLVVVVVAAAMVAVQVQAATYMVGGNQGWSIQIQKSLWAAGKSFKAGDVLVFNYLRGTHDVARVDLGGYNSCNKGETGSLTSGSDKIRLSKGNNYFICSFPGHCSAGMKINVFAA